MPAYGPNALPPEYTWDSADTAANVDGISLGDFIELNRQEIRGLWFAANRPNLFLDGGFNLWPDGTTITGISSGSYGPAGLYYRKAGAVVHDLLRSTDVPSVNELTPHANYSVHLDVTTADASIAAGDYALLCAPLEGYDWAQLAGRQFTVPFWVKAAKTGTHCVFARNAGLDRSCVVEYTISAANTWEMKAVTFPASPSAGTWDYTDSLGIEIGWTLHAGTTFQTTDGAWQTGLFYGTANQVNESDNTANNFRLALIGPPTPGPYAAPFVTLPLAMEDQRLLRYYRVYGGLDAAEPLANGFMSSTSEMDLHFDFAVPFRATPALSTTNIALWSVGTGAALTAASGAGVLTMTRKTGAVRFTTSASHVAGASGRALANSINARLIFGARL